MSFLDDLRKRAADAAAAVRKRADDAAAAYRKRVDDAAASARKRAADAAASARKRAADAAAAVRKRAANAAAKRAADARAKRAADARAQNAKNAASAAAAAKRQKAYTNAANTAKAAAAKATSYIPSYTEAAAAARNANAALARASLTSLAGPGTAVLPFKSPEEVDKQIRDAEASYAKIFPNATRPTTPAQMNADRDIANAKAALDKAKIRPDPPGTKTLNLSNAANAYITALTKSSLLPSNPWGTGARVQLTGYALYKYLKSQMLPESPKLPFIPTPDNPLAPPPIITMPSPVLPDPFGIPTIPPPVLPDPFTIPTTPPLPPRPPQPVSQCTQGAKKSVICWDGSQVEVSRCEKDIPSGVNIWMPTGTPCPPPLPFNTCVLGETKTQVCPDGSTVVTHECQQDPITGFNYFLPTGNMCPPPLPLNICVLGETKTQVCPDGSTVVTHECQRDPITGFNYFLPTGNMCPPPQLGKSIRIMAEGNLNAFDGMIVTVVAGVMCGGVPSNGETAILKIDGSEVERKKTANGFVSFMWKASIDKSKNRKVCVYVPASDICSQFGEAKDCRTMVISRQIPGIEDQLRLERQQFDTQFNQLYAERERINQIPLPSMYAPTNIQLPSYVPPLPPTYTPPLPPIEPPISNTPGLIVIPLIPKPPKATALIDVYIDGMFMGEAPTSLSVLPGKHQIRVDLGNFPPIYRSVNVSSGETTTVSNMGFI